MYGNSAAKRAFGRECCYRLALSIMGTFRENSLLPSTEYEQHEPRTFGIFQISSLPATLAGDVGILSIEEKDRFVIPLHLSA
ncbi:MAG: hypothetical protein ACI4CT_08030 [Lachnospiraceae bacterium]